MPSRNTFLKIIGVVIVIIIGVAIFLWGRSQNPGQTASGNANYASATAEPGESTGVAAQQAIMCVNERGVFVEVAWDRYLDQTTNTYLISHPQLNEMADGEYMMFEGEQSTEGMHDILSVIYPDGTFASAVGNNGLRLRDEGSFWRYSTLHAATCPANYIRVDDLLMVFAQNKRDNWTSQGMQGNSVTVWLSTGLVTFQPGEPIVLSEVQQRVVDGNADARCPTGNQALEENPLGDPQSYDLVIAQVGSSSCKTLILRGDVANWFEGARDGLRYRPSETRIFLVPLSWTENDMSNFLKAENISFSQLSMLP